VPQRRTKLIPDLRPSQPAGNWTFGHRAKLPALEQLNTRCKVKHMNRGPLNQTISIVVGRAKRHMGEPASATKWYGNDERVFRRCSDVNTALQELRHVLHLIRHADELADLRMLLKLHTVAWSSLADVLAGVINEVFDLGYAERQVDLGALLQNRRVKAAGVLDIVKRHSKAVEYERFSILRNDVVHRARLDDPELELLEKAEFEIMLAAAFDAPPDDRDQLSKSDRFRGHHQRRYCQGFGVCLCSRRVPCRAFEPHRGFDGGARHYPGANTVR
jgi:hypothetical protein